MALIDPREYRTKSGHAVTIRSAKPEDAESLVAHAQRAFETSEHLLTERDEFTMTPEDERKWISGFADAPGKLILVAELDQQIVGMLDFQNGGRRRAHHCGSLGMSIRREHRGQGIGGFLLDALLDWAKANPLIERVELAVFSGNTEALGLYRRMGFVEDGRRVRGIKVADRYWDEISMVRFVKERG